MNEQEVEVILLRLKGTMEERFAEVIKELDENGTEFSRMLKADVVNMKERAEKDMEEVWSYVKSHLVSIEQGQRMLYDPKDGIMTKILKKADAAVKMAADSALCTADASKAARDAADAAGRTDLSAKNAADAAKDVRTFSRVSIFVTAATFLGILVTVVGGYFAFINKTHEDLSNQRVMIGALQEKIKQDADNQRETVALMKKLYEKLGDR